MKISFTKICSTQEPYSQLLIMVRSEYFFSSLTTTKKGFMLNYEAINEISIKFWSKLYIVNFLSREND